MANVGHTYDANPKFVRSFLGDMPVNWSELADGDVFSGGRK